MVLLSVLKLIGIGLNTVLFAPLVVGVAAADPDRAYRLCQLWVRLNLLITGVRVRTRRLVSLDRRASYVFMANHQSHIDVLAAVAAVPEFQLRWVAKRELTRIPVFGWALRNAGHIIIDRGDHVQAMASLRAAGAQIARGVSVMIFPEGTRGPGDGTLLPFKQGGFVLAQESGAAIVPIVIQGTARILPRGAWRIAGGTVDVLVGEPIAVAGVERARLMRQVRDHLERMLPAPLPHPVGRPRLAEAR